jgi:hypothetical protein
LAAHAPTCDWAKNLPVHYLFVGSRPTNGRASKAHSPGSSGMFATMQILRTADHFTGLPEFP